MNLLAIVWYNRFLLVKEGIVNLLAIAFLSCWLYFYPFFKPLNTEEIMLLLALAVPVVSLALASVEMLIDVR